MAWTGLDMRWAFRAHARTACRPIMWRPGVRGKGRGATEGTFGRRRGALRARDAGCNGADIFPSYIFKNTISNIRGGDTIPDVLLVEMKY